MPLVRKIEDSCYKIALWEVNEDVNDLFALIKLDNEDKKKVLSFRLDKRKKEWLVSRILFTILLNENFKIQYDNKGKPELENSEFNISITHSGKYVGVILSEKFHVGIDIEKVSEKVCGIKHKFMNHEELSRIPKVNISKYICLHWCAKETLIKIMGEKHFSFKNQLPIYIDDVKESGVFIGKVINKKEVKFNFSYITIEDYILVWTLNSEIE